MQVPKSLKADTAAGVLEVVWADDHQVRYPLRYLRENCNCAVCVDELTGRRILDLATIPDDIAIRSMRHVGSYAVGIEWSDGHNTGLLTWERLRDLDPGS